MVLRKDETGWHISTLGAMLLGLAIMAAMITAIAFSPAGFSSTTTPVIVSIISLVGTGSGTLLAVWKSEQASQTSQKVHDDMRNGVLTQKVLDALEKHAEGVTANEVEVLEELNDDDTSEPR